MKYRHIEVYKVNGLQRDSETVEYILHSKKTGDLTIQAILSPNPDRHCYDIDRARSVGLYMLGGSDNLQGIGDYDHDIEISIHNYQKSRRQRLGESLAIVFVVDGETELLPNSNIVERNGYMLGIDLIDKDWIFKMAKPLIDTVMAGLFLSFEDTVVSYKKDCIGTYLINDTGKPVYSMSFSMSAEANILIKISQDSIKRTQSEIFKLQSSNLVTVNKLLSQAITKDNDDLRRFMYAWLGLETLVKKIFREYEAEFVKEIIASHTSTQTNRYFSRIREVMKGKYGSSAKSVGDHRFR
jgi:hypothetical protein